MTRLPSRLVLDNATISTLHEAGALVQVLEYWPGRWLLPVEVLGEAAAWKAHGAYVEATLRQLDARRVLEFTALVPTGEGVLFAQLQRRLGQGESAAIAIAYHRGLGVCLDDRRARRACERLSPPVPWLSTETILGEAVRGGFLTRTEAEAIWRATGIRDPNRGIPYD
jgi:predicted nucleic acid-binding protein